MIAAAAARLAIAGFRLVAGATAALCLVRLPVAGAAVTRISPPVVDLHVDLPYRVGFGHGTFARGSGQLVAARLPAANVAGVVLPLFVPHRVSKDGPRREDLEASFDRVMRLIPETRPFALPGCDAPPGAVRTWLSFEGAAPLAGDADAAARWTARGVRLFGLVHTVSNALSGTSAVPGEGGLTDAGRELVRRIHAAGGVVDVSHASDAATDELLRIAAADGVPLVASHSNARAVTDHPRNLTDAQLRGIASTGGVVGVNFHSRFLTDGPRATSRDVVRHVLHLVRVAGVDHVAIGSDFEGDIRPPSDLRDASAFPRLAAALVEAGLPADDVERIFSRNALRVLCPARDRAGGAAPGAPSLQKNGVGRTPP